MQPMLLTAQLFWQGRAAGEIPLGSRGMKDERKIGHRGTKNLPHTLVRLHLGTRTGLGLPSTHWSKSSGDH